MNLPVEQILPELVSALKEHGSAVLCAEPGAGKTTLVPPYLLKNLCSENGIVRMLEPRRIAARAAAKRISFLLDSPVGELAGYRTRFESRISGKTRIEVLTEGILTRMIQDDPSLENVDVVIFDEFHERSLHADLALALCLEVRAALRPDLKILVMSATLDAEKVSAMLGNAPIVHSPGKVFPVETFWTPRRDARSPIEQDAANAVRRMLSVPSGDVLVFLPGEGEIRRTQGMLSDLSPSEYAVLPLYGNLPAEKQNAVLEPDPEGRRKIILATSIAETSLTIDGVTVVVDSGLSRVPKFSQRNGMNRLETIRVSRASADQRRGRAGRTSPGVCCRLWSKEEDARLIEFNTPEILESDLTGLVLELANWGTRPDKIAELSWLDIPEPSKISGGAKLLFELSALTSDGAVTPHGQKMLKLPLHPRLAHAVIESDKFHFGYTACVLGAILTDRDMLRSEPTADLTPRLACVCAEGSGGADRNILSRVRESAKQTARIVGIRDCAVDFDRAGIALAFAYPDRIARRRAPQSCEYQLSNGTGAKLRTGDALSISEYLALGSVEGESARQNVYSGLPVSLSDLEKYLPGLFVEAISVGWDDSSHAVSARRERRIGFLVLTSKNAASAMPKEKIAESMLLGIRHEGFSCIPFDDSTNAFRVRVNFLRRHLGCDWPDFSDEGLLSSLETWLLPFLSDGKTTRIEHLKRLPLRVALDLMLTHGMKRELDVLAPERIEVPSGSKIRLQYDTPDGIPLLRVRLQEIFGLLDTPRLAGGKVPVAVEMLSPAMRCVQRTTDLRHFWSDSYFLVRKDMRGRYPKHNWPENPLDAVASRRTTKK